MKINRIKFKNFRIYKGENEIELSSTNQLKNINIIAGKNGFGKTTFLTSLVWCFYGKMMVEVEEKYKKDIRNIGGYDSFLQTLINHEIKEDFANDSKNNSTVSIEIELTDLSIPSMPCKSLVIKRSFDIKNGIEELKILIDGIENELTKEVGLEVFINDFILPREIAKFFFFDAEKIVSLAEAKSKSELKSLSHAYSEVLGIKKYEDLKKNLETLLAKIRRNGAQPDQKLKLQILIEKENNFSSLIEINKEKKDELEKELTSYINQSNLLQEKLIREGNGISVEELKVLKNEQEQLRKESEEIKGRLKKMLDLLPLVLAGKKIIALNSQLENERFANTNFNVNISENVDLSRIILDKLSDLNLDKTLGIKIISSLERSLEEFTISSGENTQVLLDYTPEQFRAVKAVLDNIRNGFNVQFQNIVREEKNNRVSSSRVLYKIKQAEARKDNAVAQKLRAEKLRIDNRIIELSQDNGGLVEELKNIEQQLSTNSKELSELEKHLDLVDADHAKGEVTEKVLKKITLIIQRIKEEKKYSLQKSILIGLKKLMHKKNFVRNVKVIVQEDIIDIDLLDSNDNVIDKESLSKGEQQLYATALLKALVDESGIQFPIFIDSPLQKFDKFHSENIIKEFYPSISEQVVLFPLLEKELSEIEYSYLQPNLNKVYLIENKDGASSLKSYKSEQLFNEFRKDVSFVFWFIKNSNIHSSSRAVWKTIR